MLVESSVQEDKVKPKISIESFIIELKVKRNLIPKTPVVEEKKAVETVEVKEKLLTIISEQSVKTSPESTKKKVRKRRAINRTGKFFCFI
ncbi:hypothetical protein NQ314_018249 [Rhamnusium bicolor]|uniref:Uncharacterized protein n=1 Tax=Rhamnusium bicolor TaxID=1586634 RepID=A0AAV8WS87_9CUCU|nr:hypothetical protein NQ314_018249 [Rhamnusium bicolor]